MTQTFLEWVHTPDFRNWATATLTFVAALAIFLGFRRLLWNRLHQWARGTPEKWDDALIKNLRLPAGAASVIAAAAIAGQFAPEAFRTHPFVIYGIRVAVVLVGVWILDRLALLLIRSKVLPDSLGGNTRALLLAVSRVAFLSGGLLIVLDTVGVSITPVLASLGVGSVAVALALQDTLSNFFSGLYLLADEPIRLGDFVKIDDKVEGFVDKIGWRSTHIRLLANNTVVIPNSKIASSQLTNFNLPDQESAVLIEAGVAYGSDLENVERVTKEVAREVLTRVDGGVATFDPFIRFHTFGQSSLDFTVILRAKKFTDNYLIKHEFVKALHARYQSEGISIPFPQRVVHLQRDSTVP